MSAVPDTELLTGLRELIDTVRARAETARELAPGSAAPEDVGLVAARLAAVMIGAALAITDDYEAFVRSRITEPAPAPPGDPETDHRRRLGIALGKLETARCILDEAARDGADTTQLWALAREATRLAYATVQDVILPVAAALPDAARLLSTAGETVSLWAHPVAVQDDQATRQLARERLALIADAA